MHILEICTLLMRSNGQHEQHFQYLVCTMITILREVHKMKKSLQLQSVLKIGVFTMPCINVSNHYASFEKLYMQQVTRGEFCSESFHPASPLPCNFSTILMISE